MKKRVLSIILTVAMVATFFAVGVMNAFAADVSNLEYKINGNKVTITNCNKEAKGSLIIPSKIEGCSVTTIGDGAFSFCIELTSITIPSSVTSIGYDAFDRCISLTNITVNKENSNYSSVDGILYNKAKTVLIKCPEGKTEANKIPDSVIFIDDSAFYNCDELTSITIPNGVASIGKNVFTGCYELTSITIPNSVTFIDNYACNGCVNLEKITIGKGVEYIGIDAFNVSPNLKAIIVDKENSRYYSADGILYNKSKTTLIDCPDGKKEANKIPNSVTFIGDSAFIGCTYLTSITIPNSVTSIGDFAFSYCGNLKSITIPESVTTIGDSAFKETGITSIIIPNSVNFIGNYAFFDCEYLTSVSIPDSVEFIGEKAFGYTLDGKIEGFTIYGNPGSVAEKYAKDNGFKFKTTMSLIARIVKMIKDYINSILKMLGAR